MAARDCDALARDERSTSEPVRVFGSAATIISSDAPVAPASADADPPPGVGAAELNASSNSRTAMSTSMDHHAPFLDNGPDDVDADSDQIDRRAVDDDRVHLFARLEAAHAVVAVERVRRIDRRAHQRLFERESH